jgi:hypothetical protein
MREIFRCALLWQKSRMSPACAQAERLFDFAEIDLACPQCGHEIKQKVG